MNEYNGISIGQKFTDKQYGYERWIADIQSFGGITGETVKYFLRNNNGGTWMRYDEIFESYEIMM